MSTLGFTVWDDAQQTAIGQPVQEGTISYTSSSVQGDVIVSADAGSASKRLKRVRIICDADSWVTWGENPTASSSDGRFLGASNPEYFGITAGHRIAVIEK